MTVPSASYAAAMPMPTESPRVELACPAKVNLALAVGPPEADGFHPIASWMIAVDLTDRLVLEALPSGPARFDLAFAADAPRPETVDWPQEKDLAWRAYQAVARRVGRDLPTAVGLSKRIPTGAGLGGGSANAAGVLVGLDRLWDLGLGREGLIELATTLGSDVAFAVEAMRGHASAIATGAGARLEPAPLAEAIHLTLALPGFGCPTAAVYRSFDTLRPAAAAVDPDAIRDRVRRWPASADELFNDLAAPACAVEPRLSQALRAIEHALGRRPHVTGSGSAVFTVMPTREAAARAAATLHDKTGLAAVAVTTLG